VVIQGYFRPTLFWNVWKQEKGVSGFVAVANLSSKPADTTIEVTDSKTAPNQPPQSHGFSTGDETCQTA